MKIVYITAKIPFGAKETFILTELLAVKALGTNLLIIPRDRERTIFHKEGESLIDDTLSIPWFDLKIFLALLKFVFIRPLQFLSLLNIVVFKARNTKVGLKNLIILPKALYICMLLKKQSISHIHAHWASTTSTMAYIIAKVTSIPWSFTAHRWDILENNILREKCLTAAFVRAIDERGREEIIEIIKDASLAKKISVIHMGVFLPELTTKGSGLQADFIFACPANLVIIKGHKYLLDACKILSENGFKFKCLLAGDGPLDGELRHIVKRLNLTHCIGFLGRLPQEKLFGLYVNQRVKAVVLPSIVTGDGEKEGIPVALIEAMSYGIPVISTDTGGIEELLTDRCGIMVQQKNSQAIAAAIEKLMNDTSHYNLIAKQGRRRIETSFNISIISKILLGLFNQSWKR